MLLPSLSLGLLCVILMAILLDLVLGDPKSLPHPVQIMGSLISRLDTGWNRGSPRTQRIHGFLLTATVVMSTFAITYGCLALAYSLHTVLGLLLEILLLSSCLAIKGLKDAALAVARPLSQGDFTLARTYLSHVVGRDTHTLDEAEITRGTVETLAENTVDGITAPLFWAFLGGAPLAMSYKAINTLDSMVGYKNERYADFGYASAKLDDLANWIPARLTAACFWIAAIVLQGVRTTDALRHTWQQAPLHPSPNSGWPEAMVANLLGVQLGGTNYYQGIASHRAILGANNQPLQTVHIGQSIRLMHGAWIVFTLLFALISLLGWALQ